jgi:uncharacterized protein YciI
MPLFALELLFPAGDRGRLAVRPAHRDYLRQLNQAGKLVVAGPWADDSGALIVYDVDGEDEAHQLLADDPYVREGVLDDARLREWRPIIGALVGAEARDGEQR